MDAAEQLRRVVAQLNAGAYIPPLKKGDHIMARQVKLAKGKEFHFTAGGGGVLKYPWDEWLNGDLLLLEKDGTGPDGKIIKRDYDVATDAMPPKLKTAARKRYKVVQISRKDAEGKPLDEAIIIRAREMNDEEKKEEDAQRIIDRQKNKERLLAAKEKDKAEKAVQVAQAGQPQATSSVA